MRIVHHLLPAVVLTGVASLAPAARAEQPPLFGFSVDAYAAPTLDRSVTDQNTGDPYQRSRGMLGLATLLNWDELTLGGVVDGMPGIFGDGRLSAGALVGWQPRVNTHLYQLLGEIGQERFSDVGGNFFNTPSQHDTWLGYIGARAGVTETFGGDGPFELGAWVFVRKDVGDATVTNTSSSFPIFGGAAEETTTTYRVGGYSAGVAFRVGLRFEQRRPAGEPTAPVESERAGT
jgi:hypothetical protein